jgi:hypothetical protein
VNLRFRKNQISKEKDRAKPIASIQIEVSAVGISQRGEFEVH